MHTRYTLLVWYNGINATHSLSFRKPQNCPIHDCSFLTWRLDLIQRLYRNRSETQISSGHYIEETLQVLPVDSAPPTGPSHLAMWRQTWCSTRLRPTLPLLRLIHCEWVVISRHNNDLKIEDTSREAECWSLKKASQLSTWTKSTIELIYLFKTAFNKNQLTSIYNSWNNLHSLRITSFIQSDWWFFVSQLLLHNTCSFRDMTCFMITFNFSENLDIKKIQ